MILLNKFKINQTTRLNPKEWSQGKTQKGKLIVLCTRNRNESKVRLIHIKDMSYKRIYSYMHHSSQGNSQYRHESLQQISMVSQ